MSKNKKKKCISCGAPATMKLGTDPDISGFPVCPDCKLDVQVDLVMLLCDDDEYDDDWFNDKYNSTNED